MSAALKSYIPRPVSPSAAPSSQRRPHGAAPRTRMLVSRSPKPGTVRSLPLATAPRTLSRNLTRLHRVSSMVAASLVSLTLVGYGTSVYVDRQLDESTQHLGQLQRREQQLSDANAILSRHMAQQAEQPTPGLQLPKPDQVIFLQPAPHRAAAVPELPPAPAPLQADRPLGY